MQDEMVWACADEGCRVYQEKNVENVTTMQEEKRKTKEQVYGFGKEDMRVVGVTEGDKDARVTWRQMICCGDT